MDRPFVGREAELARLCAAADRAMAGQCRVALVSGDAGIGKTRIARTLAARAEEQGALVCWGRAREDAGAPPYWPWIQVGRALIKALPNDLRGDLIGPDAAELQRLLPELASLAGELSPAPQHGDPVAGQFQLFEAVTAFLRRVATHRPLLVVLEDLHWTDQPTLRMLAHVAAELRETPVLLIGTYRDLDLARHAALATLLAELSREPDFELVPIARLTEDDVREYLHQLFEVSPAPATVATITRLTAGNPFFVEQLASLYTPDRLAAAQTVGDLPLPDGLRTVLRQRLTPLGDTVIELLTFAAVAGEDFTYATLAALNVTDDDEHLLGLLEEALSARIIEEAAEPGAYRFVNDLMRQALLSAVSTTRRAQLHGLVAEALQQRWSGREEQFASELAEHFAASAAITPAHAQPAFHYARRAGRQAERENAWDAAIGQYERALAFAGELDGAAVDDTIELLTGLGRAYREEYRVDDASAVLQRAIELAREHDRAVALATATFEVSRVFIHADDAVALVRDALERLGTREPHLRARLHAELLRAIRRLALDDDEVAFHRAQARTLAERHHFADIDAAVAHGDMVAAEFRGEYGLAVEHGEIAWRGFEQAHLPTLAMDSLHRVATNALSAGQLDLAIDRAEECVARSKRYRLPVWQALGSATLIAAWTHRADFERAALLAAEPVPRQSVQLLLQVPNFYITAGDFDGAREALEATAAAQAPALDEPLLPALHATRARWWYAVGDDEAARREVEALQRILPLDRRTEPDDRWRTAHALAYLDEAFAEVVPREDLRRWFQSDPDQAPFFRSGSLLLCYAQAARKLDEPDAARDAFERLLTVATRERAPLLVVRSHLGLAAVARDAGDEASARTHALAAATALEGLPRTPLHAEVEAAVAAHEAARSREPSAPNGLTPRELEVLALVAGGLSSREIAEQLVLSVRTVERHISNVYTKTDTHSRAQATAYALKHDLA